MARPAGLPHRARGVAARGGTKSGLEDAGNALLLHRDLWLDFDGGGFVFADSLSGTMRHGWRLDMAAPYSLMHARERGNTLLVTRRDALDGVEVRNANLDLEALGRIETRAEIPVAGWQTDPNVVRATLNFPRDIGCSPPWGSTMRRRVGSDAGSCCTSSCCSSSP